ncbi:MarR family transcriptional regulator [Clostridia bacterium OttesenSCG-928-O13]|nr:MarR family transcriptional regulator [Clostridia bacterium OttesenSCG-928-O13]
MDNFTAEGLFQQYQYTSNLIRRYLYHLKKEAGEGDFQHGQGRLMRTLLQRGDVTQKQLADEMRIRPASLSELISKLEGKGLLTRSQNQQDKRVVNLRLTEEGTAVAQKLEQVQKDFGQNLFSELSEEESDSLYQILGKLTASIERRMEEV